MLCLAEGEGRNAVHLAKLGFQVTAVDQSEAGIEKARQLARTHGVEPEFLVADLSEYEIGDSCWDAIICIFAHLPPARRERVHRAAGAGLRPDGCLVLEAYHPEQVRFGTGGPQQAPEMFMTLEQLRGDFASLLVLIARDTEREVNEGSAHTGRAAVVQVLGRRRA